MPSTQTDVIDGVSTSVAVKAAVRIMATAATTLSGIQTLTSSTLNGTVNVTTEDGDRVGIAGQSDTTQNGIYDVSTSGAWKRSSDFDGARDVVDGTIVTTEDGSWWKVVAEDPVSIGTTSILFVEQAYGGNGGAIEKIGLVSPVSSFTPAPTYSQLSGIGQALTEVAQLISNQLAFNRSISFSRITQGGAYRAWAQDKWFVFNGVIYAFFNGGTSHSSSDLSIYMTTSPDGTFWSDPVRIIGPAGVTSGVTAWGAGVDSSGNFWLIARYQGSDFLPTHSFHRLFKSTNLGSSWTAVLAPIGEVDSDSGEVPVLYHSFCELPNGHLCFGRHFSNGRVGLIEFDQATYAYTARDMYTSADVGGTALYVEPTIRRSGNTLFGFLRTQSPIAGGAQNVKMWKCTWDNATGFGPFTIVNTDIDIKFTPVPMCVVGSTVYIAYARRYDDSSGYGALYLRSAALADVLALNFTAFTAAQLVAQLPASASGSSGTGVPSIVLRNTKLVIGVSFNIRQQEDLADMGAVVIDLDQTRVNAGAVVSREQISSSIPAITTLVNLVNLSMTGTLSISDIDGSNPSRIRFNGGIVLGKNADGITLDYGSTNTTSGITESRFYNGTSVAFLLATSAGSRSLQGLAATQRVELTTDGGVLIRTAGAGQVIKALSTGQAQFGTATANSAGVSFQTVTTGFSLTVGNLIAELNLDAAGTLTSGTVTMPATPADGQETTIVCQQIVTALTLSPNSGQSIKNAVTTLAAGISVRYRYHLSNTTWYRI